MLKTEIDKNKIISLLKEGYLGLAIAMLIGLIAYFGGVYLKSDIADPLLIAMIIGIILSSFIKGKKWSSSFVIAPLVFIPIGVIFYGIKNLNFVKFSEVNPHITIILLIVVLTYFGTILLLGKVLKQKKEITYLTATGSAICGASAIAITAPAVEADSDDVSISLLSVTIAATFGLFMLLPFLSLLLNLNNESYAILSGSVMQFTGFVKASIGNIPILFQSIPAESVMGLALSVKAVRYLGLLIAIPLFASLAKKKITIPWYLTAFLFAGIIGTLIFMSHPGFYEKKLIPIVNPAYNILWAAAMAAIGLNTNVRTLLSNNGIKSLIMAFAGFIFAVIAFLISNSLLYTN